MKSIRNAALLSLAAFAIGTAFGQAGERQTIDIEIDHFLRFSQTLIEVADGAEVTIVLKNTSKLKNVTPNFVLLRPEADAARFSNAAMNAKESGYIPDAMREWVVAHTDLAPAGQSVRTTFTAKGKGEYLFISSYPGHAAMARGKLIVK